MTKKTIRTDLLCPECGNVFPIQRRVNRQKKTLHRKWLYCPMCQKTTNHIEINNIEKLLDIIIEKEEAERTEEEQKVYKYIIKRSE